MLESRPQVCVRGAKLADAAALAGVHRNSWQSAYRSIIPPLQLETMVSKRNAAWWRSSVKGKDNLLVLEVCGTVAGYATFGRARGRGVGRGEIYELYLDPVYQGLGLGEHLFEASRYQLDERRLPRLVVWALADNEPALNFYWNRGGRQFGRVRERVCGTELEKVGFAWD